VLSLSRARALGVAGITALGLGAAGSLVTASSSFAAAPTSGTACSTDGKINARGSTLQTWLQEDLIKQYASDVCGQVGPSTNLQDGTNLYYQNTLAGPSGSKAPSFTAVDPTDPQLTPGGAADAAAVPNSNGTTEPAYGGDWMISYNPYAAANFGETGSTYGRIAMSCRTDAFGGTDIPYTVSQYSAIDGTPGAAANPLTTASGKQCQTTTNSTDGVKPPTDTNLLTGSAATGTWSPAFEVTPSGGFPNTSDPTGASTALNGTEGSLMSFPIGESAVDFPVNLQTNIGSSPAVYCGTLNTKPAVKLTVADVLGLLGGSINNWNQLDGASTYTVNGVTYNDTGENPSLANCNLTVQRVVRSDDSGTTQAVVNFLNDASGATAPSPSPGAPGGSSTTATCTGAGNATTGTFGDLDSDIVTGGHNDLWPGELGAENAPLPATSTASCTAITPGGSTGPSNSGVSGGPALLSTLAATSGGIGYADFSDEKNDTAATVNMTSPTLENAFSSALTSTIGYPAGGSGVTYVAAQSGNGSNCAGNLTLPGTLPSDVGTSAEWALDAGQSGQFNSSNIDDIAWTGEPAGKYAACTLTWDYVWGNDHAANGASPDPEPELNNDQRRTLYSYFTYVFSPAGQESETTAGYAPLPSTNWDTLRQAFQGSF
jgi:hypothetical protein